MINYIKIAAALSTLGVIWGLCSHILDKVMATYIIGVIICIGLNAWLYWTMFNNEKKPDESPPTITIPLDYQDKLQELSEVVAEYENILDDQLVYVECDCGAPLFKGILSPTGDNMCFCKKCKETYKIQVNFAKILVAQPLNDEAIFDSLKNTATNDEEK